MTHVKPASERLDLFVESRSHRLGVSELSDGRYYVSLLSDHESAATSSFTREELLNFALSLMRGLHGVFAALIPAQPAAAGRVGRSDGVQDVRDAYLAPAAEPVAAPSLDPATKEGSVGPSSGQADPLTALELRVKLLEAGRDEMDRQVHRMKMFGDEHRTKLISALDHRCHLVEKQLGDSIDQLKARVVENEAAFEGRLNELRSHSTDLYARMGLIDPNTNVRLKLQIDTLAKEFGARIETLQQHQHSLREAVNMQAAYDPHDVDEKISDADRRLTKVILLLEKRVEALEAPRRNRPMTPAEYFEARRDAADAVISAKAPR